MGVPSDAGGGPGRVLGEPGMPARRSWKGKSRKKENATARGHVEIDSITSIKQLFARLHRFALNFAHWKSGKRHVESSP